MTTSPETSDDDEAVRLLNELTEHLDRQAYLAGLLRMAEWVSANPSVRGVDPAEPRWGITPCHFPDASELGTGRGAAGGAA